MPFSFEFFSGWSRFFMLYMFDARRRLPLKEFTTTKREGLTYKLQAKRRLCPTDAQQLTPNTNTTTITNVSEAKHKAINPFFWPVVLLDGSRNHNTKHEKMGEKKRPIVAHVADAFRFSGSCGAPPKPIHDHRRPPLCPFAVSCCKMTSIAIARTQQPQASSLCVYIDANRFSSVLHDTCFVRLTPPGCAQTSLLCFPIPS